jgi:hypothetical protein
VSQDDQPAPETPSQTPTWRRQLDMAAGIAILVGIVGLAVKPSLALLWVFLLIFGLTALPEFLIRRLRARGRYRAGTIYVAFRHAAGCSRFTPDSGVTSRCEQQSAQLLTRSGTIGSRAGTVESAPT